MKRIKKGIKKRWVIFNNGGYGDKNAITLFAVLFIAVSIVLIVGLTPTKAAEEENLAQATCEHELKVSTKAPSCTEEGYRQSVCTKCGYVESYTVFEKIEHDFHYIYNNITGEYEHCCGECGYSFHSEQ